MTRCLTKNPVKFSVAAWWKRPLSGLSTGPLVPFAPFCINFRLPRSVLTTCRLRRITENCTLVLTRELKRASGAVSRSDTEPQDKKQTKDQNGGTQKVGLLKRVRMLNTSEYGSGLEPPKKLKK